MPESIAPEFASALAATAGRRGVFGAHAHFYQETESTNDVAAALAERGAPDGTAVIALAQSAGRGRLGRAWFSPPGAGLYVSVVCREAHIAPMLTLAGGVAVAQGIRNATALPVQIQWPNDIVVPDAAAPERRRKLAGILAEASSGAGGLEYVVLGLGINVRPAAYPPEIASRATSIEAELGRRVDAGAVLAETLAALNEQVGALVRGQSAAVLARWRALSPSSQGVAVEYAGEAGRWRGTTAGIDEAGALLVRRGSDVERIVAGELRWS